MPEPNGHIGGPLRENENPRWPEIERLLLQLQALCTEAGVPFLAVAQTSEDHTRAAANSWKEAILPVRVAAGIFLYQWQEQANQGERIAFGADVAELLQFLRYHGMVFMHEEDLKGLPFTPANRKPPGPSRLN